MATPSYQSRRDITPIAHQFIGGKNGNIDIQSRQGRLKEGGEYIINKKTNKNLKIKLFSIVPGRDEIFFYSIPSDESLGYYHKSRTGHISKQ